MQLCSSHNVAWFVYPLASKNNQHVSHKPASWYAIRNGLHPGFKQINTFLFEHRQHSLFKVGLRYIQKTALDDSSMDASTGAGVSAEDEWSNQFPGCFWGFSRYQTSGKLMSTIAVYTLSALWSQASILAQWAQRSESESSDVMVAWTASCHPSVKWCFNQCRNQLKGVSIRSTSYCANVCICVLL